MGFEFDDNKSQSNKEKHGIDFVEAQALWNDLDRIEIPALTQEPRVLVIGKIALKHWSAVIKYISRGKRATYFSSTRSLKRGRHL